VSARFLFTCWPFAGHVFPQLSIAVALRERGHEVAFHSGETAREPIESEGFTFFAFDRVDEGRAYSDIQLLEAGMRHGRPPPRLLARTFRTWLVDTIPDQVADVRELRRRWAPDVLVADLAMWGPAVVLSNPVTRVVVLRPQLPCAAPATTFPVWGGSAAVGSSALAGSSSGARASCRPAAPIGPAVCPAATRAATRSASASAGDPSEPTASDAAMDGPACCCWIVCVSSCASNRGPNAPGAKAMWFPTVYARAETSRAD